GNVREKSERGTVLSRALSQEPRTVVSERFCSMSDVVLHSSKPNSKTDDHQWPLPESLETALPDVDAFDMNLLPPSIRPRIVDISERMQAPIDFPAAAFVTALGGAIGRRAVIQPKELDDEWIEIPNIWGV